MTSTFSLFGLALLLGAIPIAVKSTRRVGTYRQSQAWPKVQATVTQSFVRQDSGGDGTSHLPEFAFRYSVAGTEYSSSRHTGGTPFPATENDVREMLKRFPVGSNVQVAVKPADPSFAILDTGFPTAWLVLRRASVVAAVAGLAITAFEAAISR